MRFGAGTLPGLGFFLLVSLSLSGCLGSESIILANRETYETPEAYVEKRRGDHSRAKQAITPLDEPHAEKAILILPTDEAI